MQPGGAEAVDSTNHKVSSPPWSILHSNPAQSLVFPLLLLLMILEVSSQRQKPLAKFSQMLFCLSLLPLILHSSVFFLSSSG